MVVPEGISPAPVVVTDTCGSVASLTLSPSLSNQIHPAVLDEKPLPVMVIPVPAAPEMGLKDRDWAWTTDGVTKTRLNISITTTRA
jgi:hypothetical protein